LWRFFTLVSWVTVLSLHSPSQSLPFIDPQLVPIVGVDCHLPAVPLARLQAEALRQRFATLPIWEPELRSEIKYMDRASMHAAVLLPIVMRKQPTVLLTQRALHLSTHSGQIAFPGGKVDAEDADASATALREAQEEVGLDPAFVHILGTMPHYVTGSSFIITPVVALVEPHFTAILNPDEVADIFEVPLEFLMNPAHHQRHVFEWGEQRREWFSMPYQDVTQENAPQRFIWGATAGILRNFYRLLSA
jgi:8-oxo-dGTP pyrophosphatase MutT (NUDIX family)